VGNTSTVVALVCIVLVNDGLSGWIICTHRRR